MSTISHNISLHGLKEVKASLGEEEFNSKCPEMAKILSELEWIDNYQRLDRLLSPDKIREEGSIYGLSRDIGTLTMSQPWD